MESSLDETLKIHIEKLNYLRRVEASTSDASEKFNLKIKIKDLEKEIEVLKGNRNLKSNNVKIKKDANNELVSNSIKLFKSNEALLAYLRDKYKNKYDIIEKPIHLGDRSIIYKAKLKRGGVTTNIYRAIKVIKPISIVIEDNPIELHPDIENIEKFVGDGIIKVITPPDFNKFPWVFEMEFIEGYTIQKCFEVKAMWSEEEVVEIIVDILKIVNHLHKNNNVHGNLRPNEIILNKKEENKPVISPFRIVRNNFYYRRTPERIKENCRYMSPEELDGNDATQKSDQFAIGLIAFEMLNKGNHLFKGENILEIIGDRILHKELV